MIKNQNRRLVAILFADIVGSTSLMQSDEAVARQLLNKFHVTLNTTVEIHNGQIINNYGDGCLCIFDSAIHAVQCAKEIQSNLRTEPKVPVRIGLHSGDVFFENANVYGDSVNIASRIESFGIEGAILLSEQIKRHLSNQKEFILKSLGEFDFKNVESRMEVFALVSEGVAIPSEKDLSSSLTGKGRFYKTNNGFNIRKLLFLIGIISVFAFMIFFYFKIFEAKTTNAERTIAVLPLTNLSPENDSLEYFSNGLTQEIIDELAKVRSLKVTAFTQSVFYKDKYQAPIDIAKELNVRYLISGSSRIIDGKLKLAVELFNPHTNERIWNKTYIENMEHAQVLQISIAKEVASNLHIDLSPSEILTFDNPSTNNGEAFRLLLQAKSELNKLTEEGFRRSRKLLNEAIRLDPKYTQAYTLLAWSLILSGDPTIVSNTISSERTLELAEPMIERSMELNSKNSDLYLVRANLNLFAKNKIEAAQKDVEKALEIGSWPHVPTNYCTCIFVSTYIAIRNVEMAKKAANISKKLDPGNIFISWDQANIYMLEEDFQAAQKLFHEAVEMSDDSYFNTYLGWSYYHGMNYDQALKYLLKGNEMAELPIALNTAYLSNVYYRLKDTTQSNVYLQNLLDRNKAGEHHINLHLSLIYAGRENREKTIEYLNKAFANKEYQIAYMTNLDPVFKFIKDDARFISLREKMK